MNATFQDLQDANNPRNGQVFSDRAIVVTLLQELRGIEPPFVCQFTGANGINLTIGVAHDFGWVQHCSNDGLPPYLMAISNVGAAEVHDIEFLCGDTATPIDGRYRISFDELCETVAEFVATGERSGRVAWEDLD